MECTTVREARIRDAEKHRRDTNTRRDAVTCGAARK